MTNFNNGDNLIAFGDTAGARVADDFSQLLRIPVPDFGFDWPTERAQRRHRVWSGLRVAGATAGMLTVALVAAFVAPHFWSDEPKVSAAEILAQAAAVAAGEADTPPYHMVSAYQLAPGRDYNEVTEIVTEIWYGGSDRYRLEYRSSQGPDSSYLDGNVVNGDDAWRYLQNRCELPVASDPRMCDGVLRAVHGPSSALGVGGDSLAGPGSLGAVIAAYGPGSCRSADLQGDDIVLGRATYVVAITPDAGSCPPRGEDEQGVRIESVRDSSETIWVDKETFLVLRSEHSQREGVSSVYGVSQIEVGEDLPESIFTYQSPEGVAVQEVENYREAAEVLGPPLD